MSRAKPFTPSRLRLRPETRALALCREERWGPRIPGYGLMASVCAAASALPIVNLYELLIPSALCYEFERLVSHFQCAELRHPC